MLDKPRHQWHITVMKKVYLFRQNFSIDEALQETCPEMLAALYYRNSQAQSLAQDQELSQLHRLLALVRLGHVELRTSNSAQNTLWHLQISPPSFHTTKLNDLWLFC